MNGLYNLIIYYLDLCKMFCFLLNASFFLLQKEIESLHTENALLKKSVEQLQKSSSNPQELVTAVKKVMNTVFKTLKAQFAEEKSYLGSVVMEKLLNVIRVSFLHKQIKKKGNSEKNYFAFYLSL